MNSLSDLNKISGKVYNITDTRTPAITYTSNSTTDFNYTDYQQTANKNGYIQYSPKFEFASIVNGGAGYLDFRYDGGLTIFPTNAVTSGYSFSVEVYRTINPSTYSDFNSLKSMVSFAGVQMAWSGYPVRLEGIGSGTMYASWTTGQFNGSGIPISFVYTVYGIKSMADWALVRRPVINTNGTAQNRLDFVLKTSYRTDTWTAGWTTDSSLDNGITIPPDVVDKTNTNLLNFSRDRQTFANIANQYVFDNYAPYLNYGDSSTYTANVSVSSGFIGNSFGASTTTVSLNGSISDVNYYMSRLRFTPNIGEYGNKTMTISVKRDGTTIVNNTVGLEITGNLTSTQVIGNVYVFTTSQTFTPSATEKTQRCDILSIGGGRGGNKRSSGTGSRSGGQAGHVVANIGMTMNNSSYTIHIGSGGPALLDGVGGTPGNTYITGSTSGNIVIATAGGWTNANISGNAYTGGEWTKPSGASSTYGGGGGGATSAGSDGTTSTPGIGGAGISSTDIYLARYLANPSAYGGSGDGGSNNYPNGYGNGGNGARSSQSAGAGTAGVVVLRFY
jgi:hypothetical protein